jgi:hypothetical protein
MILLILRMNYFNTSYVKVQLYRDDIAYFTDELFQYILC